MMGYVVRSAAESWMQGFITQTTFTTWQRYFTWDSYADNQTPSYLLMRRSNPPAVCGA